MILQVVSHRKVGVHADAHLVEVRRRTDAAQHQDLRAADGACRQDHFFRRVDFVNLVLALKLHAVGLPLLVDQDTVHVAVHGDVQVRSLAHRSQERFGCGTAITAPDRS